MKTTKFYHKLFAMFVALSMLISACGVTLPGSDADIRNKNAINTAVAATVTGSEQPAAAQVEATEAPTEAPTQAPAAPTEAPASKPAVEFEPKPLGSVLDMSEFEYWQQFSMGFTDPELHHGALIDRTNVWYMNIKRDTNGGNTLTTGPNQVNMIMTGDYPVEDHTYGNAVVPYLVYGETGFYMQLPGTTITLETANAYVTLNNWTGELTPRPGTPALTKGYVEATTTVSGTAVNSTIARLMGTEELFAELDRIVAKAPNAVLANGYYAEVKTVAGQSFVWTKCGEVSTGWGFISESDGKCLYVAKVTGTLEVMFPFGGGATNTPYPNYHTLTAVTSSAQPADVKQCVPNSVLANTVNQHRQTDELVPALALLPSTTHPKGTRNIFWNTFVFTSGDAGSAQLLGIDMFDQYGAGNNEFRGLYFVTTDGQGTFAANSATITPCTGGFSPEVSFNNWWGK